MFLAFATPNASRAHVCASSIRLYILFFLSSFSLFLSLQILHMWIHPSLEKKKPILVTNHQLPRFNGKISICVEQSADRFLDGKRRKKKEKENFVGSKRRKWEEKIEILIELALSHWNRNRSGNGGGLAMARIDLDVTRARVGLSPYGGNSVVGKSLSIEASKSPRLK